MNNPKDVQDMYIKKDTLSTRVNLHEKYSVNKYGWSNWVFDQYNLCENSKILEFGCGTGSSWIGKQIPEKINIVLTDISPLMIDKTMNNLGSNDIFSFQIIDVQNVPFPDKYFDIIIANHMLYHVPDMTKALTEIKRILKNNGIFYATTVGINHLRELQDIYRKYENRVKFSYSDELSFTLENGENILKKYFVNIEQKRYIDSLEVTQADDLMEYIVSYNEIPEEIKQEIYVKIYENIIENGILRINKDSGIFICRI
jgi:ubiquinone/menaquinone biosynthesis C-methylase UbiE